jgi:hypothetical protein
VTTTYPTRSRQQLVDRALNVLGVVASGQTPDTEDRALVDSFVEPVLARLDGKGVTTIPDADAIPAAQFLDVAVILADAAKNDFGLAALPQGDPAMAERNLTIIVSTGPTMETIEDYDADGDPITFEQPQTSRPEWF